MLKRWIEKNIYYHAAPLRSVEGPYVLVLRSFENRMVIQRQVKRLDPDGKEFALPEIIEQDPNLRALVPQLRDMGLSVDLGEPKPDLTVVKFLGEVRAYFNETLISVSNGTSLGGVLTIVQVPDENWFDYVKIMAAHAKAILIVPDGSAGLRREVEYVVGTHPEKLFALMPPSDTRVEIYRDMFKKYQFKGIHMGSAWENARLAFEKAGAPLPEYDNAGAVLRWATDRASFSKSREWSSIELADILASQSGGDAQQARDALHAAKLKFLRYDPPEDKSIDEAWYKRAFPERHHVQDDVTRLRLAKQFPILGLASPDHVMAAPLPGSPDIDGKLKVALNDLREMAQKFPKCLEMQLEFARICYFADEHNRWLQRWNEMDLARGELRGVADQFPRHVEIQEMACESAYNAALAHGQNEHWPAMDKACYELVEIAARFPDGRYIQLLLAKAHFIEMSGYGSREMWPEMEAARDDLTTETQRFPDNEEFQLYRAKGEALMAATYAHQGRQQDLQNSVEHVRRIAARFPESDKIKQTVESVGRIS